MNPSIAIITPAISLPTLSECLQSVKLQTYKNFVHHIFIDGKEHFPDVEKVIKRNAHENLRTNILEDNIGKGWYGHRIYAASSFLVNQDILVYLDPDNWIEPDHLSNFIDTFQSNPKSDWTFSFRKIFDVDGEYICDDNCESLGKWPTFHNPAMYHIDTSCYAIKREVAVKIGHSWYGQWGADRQFFSNLQQYFPNFTATKKHTLCYRLGGNEGSVKSEFFMEGNKKQIQKYNGNFPWLKENERSKHYIGPGIQIQT